jgi:hypothetical protein
MLISASVLVPADIYLQLIASVQAYEYSQRALDIRKRIFGNAHPDTAKSLYCLADLHLERRELALCEQLTEQCLEIFKQVRGYYI